jgi:hypothetical protein
MKEYRMQKIADMTNLELVELLALVNANNAIPRKTTGDLRHMENAIRANDATVWPERVGLPFNAKGSEELFRNARFMQTLYDETRTRFEALPGYDEVAGR